MFKTRPCSSLPYFRAGCGPLVVMCATGAANSSARANFTQPFSNLAGSLADRYLLVGVGLPSAKGGAQVARRLEDTLETLVHEHGRAVAIEHAETGGHLYQLARSRPDLFAGMIGGAAPLQELPSSVPALELDTTWADQTDANRASVVDFLHRIHPPFDPESHVREPDKAAEIGPQPSQTASFYIDPQLQPALAEAYYPQWDPIGTRERAAANARPAVISPGTRLQVVEIGAVSVRVWHPPGKAERALLAIHGGGFMAGSAQADDQRNSELAARLNAVVASPDYRLAPEHPFPAAANDCLAALGALDLPLFILGDSAGGGLAETTAVMMLERGEAPMGLIMLEPFLDPSMSGRSMRIHHQAQMWNRVKAYHAWRAYLADTHPGELPRLVDHPGCGVRVLTVVAAADSLRDEGIIWTTDLVDVGFNAALHMLAGTYHGGLSTPGTQVWEQVKSLIENFMEVRQ
ncbi:acetyl esterase/lipase [Trueperella bonasi]|uniref:Acetyl esterase/lipase n=1 Tax=Trueperella bonasi TaxID=312286 RepID=A0ABT9NH47_9ACTO|nr:alpha/beta hydrolase fold domain-containing protein [Trueperella bonasi]MDP9806716.1 acetyl esterase/lipase [Trueperella bonasi]